ncbi:hypothetical protein Pcinc_010511 [Petrolisthes cinctipes]|uniref:HTH psq-type domain-containing protein n=1 Tax=Petrolisthes cinctipes TaxID=88211 RepID=A0AAE1G2W2_PETCI|nr:hypothetical protein Pcinc_010511 [Petrolisthes cinctipes]
MYSIDSFHHRRSNHHHQPRPTPPHPRPSPAPPPPQPRPSPAQPRPAPISTSPKHAQLAQPSGSLERVLEELMGEAAWLKAADSSPREGATPNPPQADSPTPPAPPPPTESPPVVVDSPLEDTSDVTLDLSTPRQPPPPTSTTPHDPSTLATLSGGCGGGVVTTKNVGVGVGLDVSPRLPLDLYTANLPPHLLPWLLSTHLHHLARTHQAQQEEQGEEKEALPLDLSAKTQAAGRGIGESGTNPSINPLPLPLPRLPFEHVHHHHHHHHRTNTTITTTNSTSTTTITPAPPHDTTKLSSSCRGRRRGDLSKRSYTEEELQAALRDIQSGKLGTRRAAVIYGIPRSTLRNKVYKLAMERERNKKLVEQTRGSGVPPDVKPLPLQQPTCQNGVSGAGTEAGEGGGGDVDSRADSFRTLLKNKMAEKLEEMRRQGLGGGASRRVVEAALTHLLHHLPRLALHQDPSAPATPTTPPLAAHPHLADMVQRVLEERCREELQRSRVRANGCAEPLTVPAYPSCNGVVGEQHPPAPQPSPPLAPSTNLKEMIAQMIGQKLGCEVPRDSPNTRLTPPISTPSQGDSLSRSGDRRDSSKKTSNTSSSNGGKGSRPKRGKYRNYDRDNLVKAVQAVQSGEMSVHRAGSFYGVPHSTLEYKVKERHLSRSRGKKDSPTPTIQDKIKREPDVTRGMVEGPQGLLGDIASHVNITRAEETTTIDLTGDEGSRGEETSAQPLLKKLRVEGDYPGALPSAPMLHRPFPLWRGASLVPPLLASYHQDLYASHMIRRFQEAAQGTSSPPARGTPSPPIPETPPSPPHHGSVLDALLRGKATASGMRTTPPTTSVTNINTSTTSTSTSTSPVPCPSPRPGSEPSWQVSSSLLSLSKGLVVEQQGGEEPSPPLLQPPGVLALNTLYLPALAARTALAAALHQRSSRGPSPEVDVLPLPLVKEAHHPTPVAADHP